MADPRQLGDHLALTLTQLDLRQRGERWPVIRYSDRDEIPYDVRYAVYRRDRFRCSCCGGGKPKRLELDHIVPWSAGGSDGSRNLRALCPDCNTERSNFYEDTSPKLPVTWWCLQCYAGYSAEDDPMWPRKRPDYVRESPSERIVWLEGIPRCYCSWCGATGYSTVVL